MWLKDHYNAVLKMMAVTPFSKFLEDVEMCAYSIFFFKTADTTDTLDIEACVNPTVFKKKSNKHTFLYLLATSKMELRPTSLTWQYRYISHSDS